MFILVQICFSCSKSEANNEEVVNRILASIIADNTDLFDKECKLLDQFSQRFMPPATIFENDSTFIEAMQGFVSEEEIEDLLIQKHSFVKYKFSPEEFQSKFQFISIEKFDSLHQTEEPIKKADYWQVFQNDLGCLQIVSKILITKNKKTAIIKYGSLSGTH